MIEFLVLMTLIADEMDHQSHGDLNGIHQRRHDFEMTEKYEDEVFFRSKVPGKDLNEVYYPDSTVPKQND